MRVAHSPIVSLLPPVRARYAVDHERRGSVGLCAERCYARWSVGRTRSFCEERPNTESESHLSVRQSFLLALARDDQDRACRREVGKRGRESEEGGHDASVIGHPETTHLSAAAGAVVATCDGDEHGPPSEVPIASVQAPSAGVGRADDAVIDISAHGGAAHVAGDVSLDGVGSEVVAGRQEVWNVAEGGASPHR